MFCCVYFIWKARFYNGSVKPRGFIVSVALNLLMSEINVKVIFAFPVASWKFCVHIAKVKTLCFDRKVRHRYLLEIHFIRFHHHPENWKLSSWFSLMSFRLCFLLFPLKYLHVFSFREKSAKLTSHSLPLLLLFTLVSPSPVERIVKAKGPIRPCFKVVDAVQMIVLMPSHKCSLVARSCQTKTHISKFHTAERVSHIRAGLYLRFMQVIFGTSHRPSPRQRIVGTCLWMKPLWHWYLTNELISYLSRFLPKVCAFSTKGGWLQATETQSERQQWIEDCNSNRKHPSSGYFLTRDD